jgi:hypothetical protein
MMKTIQNSLITLAAILAAILGLTACAQPVTPAAGTTGRVILSVSAGTPGAARTILPGGTPAFSRYEAVFDNGSPLPPVNATPAQIAEGLELAAGTWTVTVKAYRKFTPTTGSNANQETEYLAAQGVSAPFTVGNGELVTVPVALEPFTLTDTAVKGIFTYKVTFPADVIDAWMSFGGNGYTLTSGQWVSMETTPGAYPVAFFVRKSPLVAGISEMVHVYSGPESKAEFTFEDADFARPAPLSYNTWTEGELTTGTQTDLYSFPAEAGKTYALQWDDYYGAGAYAVRYYR